MIQAILCSLLTSQPLDAAPQPHLSLHPKELPEHWIRILQSLDRWVGHRAKGGVLWRQGLSIQPNECSLVTHLIAVIGRREDRNQPTPVLDFIPLLLHLVAADDEFEVICLKEVGRHILPKRYANAPLGSHAAVARLRVAPEHLCHQALIRRLAVSIHLPDRVQRNVVLREEASMDNKDFRVDDVAQRKEAKRLAEQLVQLLVVLFGDLPLKTVEFVHVPCLVVTPGQVHMSRVQELPCEESNDDLHGKGAPVYEVPVKNVRVVL
mmetsp:Transcript_13091/g.28852  ORF Transcript_13091/g.28852 Transcript_13091/m.28852 type:complete len:265 (-) Transcript_13091:1041-1835(-)